MMNTIEITLIGFFMGLLAMSSYYFVKQVIEMYKYIIKGGKI